MLRHLPYSVPRSWGDHLLHLLQVQRLSTQPILCQRGRSRRLWEFSVHPFSLQRSHRLRLLIKFWMRLRHLRLGEPRRLTHHFATWSPIRTATHTWTRGATVAGCNILPSPCGTHSFSCFIPMSS